MLRDIHPDKAVEIIVQTTTLMRPGPETEFVPLSKALGRVLPRPLSSPIDHPPFDKSAMDGYAYSELVSEGIYRVVGAVAAGREADKKPGRGEVVKIMTGAPLPEVAAGVQRVERTKEAGKDEAGRSLVAFTNPEQFSNIIRKGENLAAGSILLSPRVLAAQDIGIIASGGLAGIEAAVRPLVGIVSTGDELALQGRVLPKAAIYDSNGPQLASQAQAAGVRVSFYGIVRDLKKDLSEDLSKALDECDILLVSGGVSMGDFDLVPSVLETLGVEPIYHGLLMRPGKPSFFGARGRTVVFGLPGNPVSTFVNFEILVKPCLYAMMGLKYAPPMTAAVLGASLERREVDRVEFLPARLVSTERGPEALALAYKGSSMITVLAEADALLRMELGRKQMEKGAIVHARRIRP
ncbi:MAG: molybdopterin molybdotransferase MoeA [Spirochaetes bacterium]|nr:molybdopterin molybdotransferase MoeA [Spirochaetota bacterium]